ncbi:hypothetical protein EVA_16675 [gut metagenome]|uniref:Uncharacterized protein n=1 Tax=gut metagenome TaxID=749906 RepID=J9C5V5_9ZZZZ
MKKSKSTSRSANILSLNKYIGSDIYFQRWHFCIRR